MSFLSNFSRYATLHKESVAWELLRQKNAPLILAFIEDVFHDESDVEYGKARVRLETHLDTLRENEILTSETDANSYLRQWLTGGWLREMNGFLTRTDACETALRFCHAQENRNSSANATRLRIVQDTVRDLSLSLTDDKEKRLDALYKDLNALQAKIDNVEQGNFHVLSESEKIERIKDTFQLAFGLTADFRRVEDEMREMDRRIREAMVTERGGRGALLERIFEEEELLSNTESGKAFDGFNALLCDSERSLEFREDLKSILASDTSHQIPAKQRKFLANLPRELAQESKRVLHVRRRLEEGLRSFVERGSIDDNETLSLVIRELEQTALKLKDTNVTFKEELSIQLFTGTPSIESIGKWSLRTPDQTLTIGDIEEQSSQRGVGEHVMSMLAEIDVLHIVENIHAVLLEKGPLSLAEINEHLPITNGINELVTWIRIAKAVRAMRLPEDQTFVIQDDTEKLSVTTPGWVLNAESFPEDLNNIDL